MPHSATATTTATTPRLSRARNADDAPHGLIPAACLPGACHVCARARSRLEIGQSIDRASRLPPTSACSHSRSRVLELRTCIWMDGRLTTTDAWCLECTLIHHKQSPIAGPNQGKLERERTVLRMHARLSHSLVLWLSSHDQYRASSSFASSSSPSSSASRTSSSCASSACSVAHAPVLAFELEARVANADRQGVYLRVVYVVYRRRSLD
ncbi:unnamed protein product [Taenia asiatica]|uniref:Uncharacterized protein n=1 Tax=Taenia asiatica TaxID=60517 RepID=A0A0R3WBQ1_TAEAS|nr:unnamed protein product [Taenia asiatica]